MIASEKIKSALIEFFTFNDAQTSIFYARGQNDTNIVIRDLSIDFDCSLDLKGRGTITFEIVIQSKKSEKLDNMIDAVMGKVGSSSKWLLCFNVTNLTYDESEEGVGYFAIIRGEFDVVNVLRD